MQIASWLYVSTNLVEPHAVGAELEKILEVSRERNAALDVTGALLFTGARFVQLLEGPAQAISTLQSEIFRDPRHGKIITISNYDATRRMFPAQPLAYADPSAFVIKTVEDAVITSEAEPDEGAARLSHLLMASGF